MGHSDGDVLTHAIADALLGAAGLGDIGRHFPDTEEEWRGSNSLVFLETIKVLLEDRRLAVGNVDSVVVLDKPKLALYMSQIRGSIANALGVSDAQVNVKAKTSEGASPTIAAAHAIALLVQK